MNASCSDVASLTIPQIPLFVIMTPPPSTYAGEAQSWEQPASTATSVVTWWADAGYTTLLHTGTTYAFSAPAAGAANLYVKDVGTITQTGTISYDCLAPAFCTASINQIEAGNKDLDSLVIPASSFPAGGGWGFNVWICQSYLTSQWGSLLYWDANNSVQCHMNSSNPYFNFKAGGSTSYMAFGGGGMQKVNEWICLTLSQDPVGGTFSCWIDGVLRCTASGGVFGTSMFAGGADMRTDIRYKWGNTANIAIYNDSLTTAEGIAIQNGGAAGDSVDLSTTGAPSKLAAYWSINTDSWTNSAGDIITDVTAVSYTHLRAHETLR